MIGLTIDRILFFCVCTRWDAVVRGARSRTAGRVGQDGADPSAQL